MLSEPVISHMRPAYIEKLGAPRIDVTKRFQTEQVSTMLRAMFNVMFKQTRCSRTWESLNTNEVVL
jgi:hypothetical protein